VLIFVGYLGLQLFRFAQPPAIIVSDPPTVVSTVEDDLTSYVLRGSSVANATVSIDTPGRDTLRVSADPQGRWEATVELRRGRNQFDVAATDPDTGKRSNDTIRLFITVPFTVVQAPTLTLESPADGASFENGAIPVQGRAANAARVTVSATYVGPAPGQRSSGPLPRAPGAESVKVGSDGDFTVPYELSTGRWTLTITAASDQNKTTTLTRAITIDYQGVNLVIQIKGGRAWLKVWVDGEPDAGVGAGGRTYNEGKKLTFSAKHSIEVLTGSSGYTYFTLNGQPLGPLGKPKVVETWLFQPPDQPRQTSRR